MGLLEGAKKFAEKMTGIARPSTGDLASMVRARKPACYRFKDDGIVPNHPRWPLLHYRAPVALTEEFDAAAVFEELFERNGWSGSWRDSVYDYLHYHSRINEVMGVARGSAVVQFGGTKGRKLKVKTGDVIILPAGTGHQCMSASEDFLVVGAYPATGTYDVCRPTKAAYERAQRTVPKVAAPRKDPVYGKAGSLIAVWKAVPRKKAKALKRKG